VLGDDEANIEIGKHYLHIEGNPPKAISYLQRVRPSGRVTEAGVEESAKLLKETRKTFSTSRIPAR
jgi:hypothetical protein